MSPATNLYQVGTQSTQRTIGTINNSIENSGVTQQIDNSSIFPENTNQVSSTTSNFQEINELTEITEEIENTNDTNSLVDILKNLITVLQGILTGKGVDALNGNKKVDSKEQAEATNKTNDSSNANELEVGEIVDVTIPGVGQIEGAEYMDIGALNAWFEELGYHPEDKNNIREEQNVDLSEVGAAYKTKGYYGGDVVYITNKNGEIMNRITVSNPTGSAYGNRHNIGNTKYIKVGDEYVGYHSSQGIGLGDNSEANFQFMTAHPEIRVKADGTPSRSIK